MSFGGRIAAALGLFVIAAGLAVWAVVGFLLPTPPTVDFTSAQPTGAPVDLTMQTVGSIGFGQHPTWVSYLVKNPSGQWIHSTIWKVPAHTRINLTIQQFDSGSPLRNQQWGMVAGTIGGIATLNGKPIPRLRLQQRKRRRPHLLHPHPGDHHPADRQPLLALRTSAAGAVLRTGLGGQHHQGLLHHPRGR